MLPAIIAEPTVKKPSLSTTTNPFAAKAANWSTSYCRKTNFAVTTILQKSGVSPDKNYYKGKYAYLDLPEVHQRIIQFTDGRQTHINWYLPQMHCSSCVYLLENLHRLQEGVISAVVNFPEKRVRIIVDEEKLS